MDEPRGQNLMTLTARPREKICVTLYNTVCIINITCHDMSLYCGNSTMHTPSQLTTKSSSTPMAMCRPSLSFEVQSSSFFTMTLS